MRILALVAVWSLAAGPAAVPAARAAVPNAASSSIGTSVLLGGVGSDGQVDPYCRKVIIVRNAAYIPEPGSVVMIDFTDCEGAGEVRVASVQPFPGMVVNCNTHIVSAVTDIGGNAVFRIVGASNLITGAGAGVGERCARVIADGVPLGFLSVGTPDFNGANGTPSGPGIDALDTALFAGARYGSYRSTANLVGPPGTIDGQDTMMFSSFRFGHGSVTNGPFCP